MIMICFLVIFFCLSILIFEINLFKQKKAVKKFMDWTKTEEYKNLIEGRYDKNE